MGHFTVIDNNQGTSDGTRLKGGAVQPVPAHQVTGTIHATNFATRSEFSESSPALIERWFRRRWSAIGSASSKAASLCIDLTTDDPVESSMVPDDAGSASDGFGIVICKKEAEGQKPILQKNASTAATVQGCQDDLRRTSRPSMRSTAMSWCSKFVIKATSLHGSVGAAHFTGQVFGCLVLQGFELRSGEHTHTGPASLHPMTQTHLQLEEQQMTPNVELMTHAE